jgi:hypothetical protein
MKFEDQYPGIERYQGINTKLRKERELRITQALKREKERKAERREMIGMIILVPIFMALLFAGYIFAWAVTPPEWW